MAGAGEYDVYSEYGAVYRVDLIVGTCDCPDHEHNAPAGGCKHVRRVELETGQREVPDLARETDVERMIDAREHTIETTSKAVATDGGQFLEETPGCSEHIENPRSRAARSTSGVRAAGASC